MTSPILGSKRPHSDTSEIFEQPSQKMLAHENSIPFEMVSRKLTFSKTDNPHPSRRSRRKKRKYKHHPNSKKTSKQKFAAPIFDEPTKASTASSNFSTPPQTKSNLSAFPGTPHHSKHSLPSSLFKCPLDESHETNTDIIHLGFFSTYSHEGKDYTLIKQKSKKGCGAAAFFMLWTDRVKQKTVEPTLSDACWRWFTRCYGASGEDVIYMASKLFNISLEETRLPSNIVESCAIIQDLILTTEESILTSIDHPKIGGHWIVVDHVNMQDQVIHIRDPYAGQAYQVSFDEAKNWFGEDLGERTGSCLHKSIK